MTVVLFIRHSFNKVIKKHVAGVKSVQTLRHAITRVQEAGITLNMYEGLNDDDPLVIHITTAAQNDPVPVNFQYHNGQVGNPDFKSVIRPN